MTQRNICGQRGSSEPQPTGLSESIHSMGWPKRAGVDEEDGVTPSLSP